MSIDYYRSIQKNYGYVRRARGFYLYTDKGIRLIDMNLDGARSILGRRAENMQLTLKQKMDKGFLGYFPTPASYQLKKLLASFFPHHVPFLYACEKKAFLQCRILLGCEQAETDEPAEPTEQLCTADFCEKHTWRPFADGAKDSLLTEKAFVLPPPAAVHTSILMVNTALPQSVPIVPPDDINQAEIYFITKLLHAELKNADTENFSLPEKLLQQMSCHFVIQGRYAYSTAPSDSDYEQLFSAFLQNRILLSADRVVPSVLPLLEHYTELEKALKNV